MRDEDKPKIQLLRELGAFEAELEQKERQSEERRLYLENVFACAPDAIVASDGSGRISEWNAGAERLFGYSAQHAIGRNIDDLIGGDAQLTRHALSGATIPSTEVTRYRHDGTPLAVMVACAPIVIDGELVGAVAVYTDMTERRRLEAQLRQAQRMEALGRLAGGIAHDFNNLLTAIQGYTELVLHNLEDGGQVGEITERPIRADLEEIERVAQRAGVLVRQLLTFSREQKPQPQVLDLNQVIQDVEKMLRRLIGEDITLTTSLLAAPGEIEADVGQIEQVIVNLAVNARDAMPKGGDLHIETTNVCLDASYTPGYLGARQGQYVVLTVSDTGIGMSQDILEHLFEPFFTTKAAEQGTGLGLTTVYGIVRQMEGDIHVHSKPAHGTTFRLLLPQSARPSLPANRHRPHHALALGSEAILLVEDEETVRELARRVLERQGYSVVETGSPEKALALHEADCDAIDLLITDVILPGFGGQELAERLVSACPSLRVLYVSGYLDDVVAGSGALEPGASFLQKPFTPTELANAVREVLDRRDHERSA